MIELFWGRFSAIFYAWLLTLGAIAGAQLFPPLIWLALPTGALALLGIYDYFQKQHGVIANYPLMGRMRYILEAIRPELRQYFWESDADELPYSRTQRAMVYRRAKNISADHPFGSVKNVYLEEHSWLNHSLQPKKISNDDFRVMVGEGSHAYAMSILNISGTSFGALSPNAIQALNTGARLGNFAHNTGEGSLSPYHEAGGGDLIWQISTGYFGCRTAEGAFDPDKFQARATLPQVKMIEIKLSQGAKPGHGGVLRGSKVSAVIAATRGVPEGEDCISPSRHSEFSTPNELLDFAERLRVLSGGKPVGIKLCIGHPWEFISIVRAMVDRKQYLDFITVDGAEGGTGAAPVEFADNMGCPLRDALVFVDNTLRGAGLRDRVKIGASGKIVSAYDVIRHCALGADWCNMARPFMFALGCIQARDCASNHCPTGIATMDPKRYRVLDIASRAERVRNFQQNTRSVIAKLLGSAGLNHPSELNRRYIVRRVSPTEIRLADQIYPHVDTNALIEGQQVEDPRLASYWHRVSGDSFQPIDRDTRKGYPTDDSASQPAKH